MGKPSAHVDHDRNDKTMKRQAFLLAQSVLDLSAELSAHGQTDTSKLRDTGCESCAGKPHCLFGTCGEVIGQECIETAFLDDLHAFLNIGALEADHQRLAGTHGLHTCYHGFGDMV